jgi:hypothetical protein
LRVVFLTYGNEIVDVCVDEDLARDFGRDGLQARLRFKRDEYAEHQAHCEPQKPDYDSSNLHKVYRLDGWIRKTFGNSHALTTSMFFARVSKGNRANHCSFRGNCSLASTSEPVRTANWPKFFAA